MAADVSAGERSLAPLRPRPFLLASEVPRLMAQPSVRGRHLPLRQFVKDWFSPLADWPQMVADPLPSGCPAGDGVRVATVVHALCDQAGLVVPPWVFEHRFDAGEMLVEEVPWDSALGASEREDAPPACQWHECWFGSGFLDVLGVHVR